MIKMHRRFVKIKLKDSIHFLLVIVILSSLLAIAVKSNNITLYNLNKSTTIFTEIGNWSETAKLVASDGAGGDWFGISVAIYGNYSVIGARDDDAGRGSAYVFKRDGYSWVQEQKLLASDGVASDWFGISVAIYGDFIFVGADADDNENGVNAGSVYVFKRDGDSWIQQDKLLASDGMANDYFGRYVCVDNDFAVIGAYYDDNIAGSAYVFKKIDNQWIEEEKLIASDRMPGDYFGISTSIEGDYAVIGAYRDDNDNGVDAGSVYVFKRTTSGWIEEIKLLASDGADGDRFGISTACDDTYLVIGSYYDDGNIGSAYIFNKTSIGWVEETKLVASDGGINDFFGRSVSIDKDYILVGAWGDSSYSGSVYTIKRSSTGWVEETKLSASDATSNDRFGYQVSLHDQYAIIGAYYDDNNNGIDAGAAYIFDRINYEPVPPIITGPTDGKAGILYSYNVTSLDPDGDQILFYVDWGDGDIEDWFGPYASGELVTLNHTWDEKDTYIIRVKARDVYGAVSQWTTLDVTMPISKTLLHTLFINLLNRFPLLLRFLFLMNLGIYQFK